MSTQIVSLNPSYTFPVTGDRILTAVFASVAPQEYAYTGNVVSVSLYPGVYKLEAWGAEGGYRSSASYAGKGGYSAGTLTLTETTTVFVRAGGSGNTGKTSGGFNGGGKRATYNGGGGASDIRISVDDYNHRVIVAGGGGSDGSANKAGGYGGGTIGQSRTDNYGSGGFGGTQTGVSNSSWQTSAPSTNTTAQAGAYAGFGFGGNGISANGGYGGAGGGGWYGGSGSMPDGSGDDDRGGAGGSGFVWTGANAPAGFGLTEAHCLTNARMIDGSQSFASPAGTMETGHSGNGYVRITPVVFYVVTVLSEDAAKGTVSGGGQYENGAQATVTASPTMGYKLSGWYEGDTQVSTEKSYTFTVSGNRTLTVRFVEAAVYTITATIDPSGTGTVTGAGRYTEGDTVTLVATAGDGYTFSGWQEGGATISTANPYTFAVTAGRVLTAVFEEKPAYTLGKDWWEAEYPAASYGFYCVAYGNGKFVALSHDKAYYSTDGVNWSTSSLPASTSWGTLTFGNGTFVAVGGNGISNNYVIYSADGVAWTKTTVPFNYYWQDIAFGNGRFVAVGYYNTSPNNADNKKAATSVDGSYWSQIALRDPSRWNGIAYGSSKFVMVGMYGRVLYSTTGLSSSWTSANLPTTKDWIDVAYGNGKFVAVSYGENAAHSSDGITWTASALPESARWKSVAYGEGIYVAVQDPATSTMTANAAYSPDGETWTATTLPVSGGWTGIAYGDGKFVAVSRVGKIIYSSTQGPAV